MKGGSKYQPLFEYFQKSDRTITLTFTEIETLIGDTLPDSARTQKRWWGNRHKGAQASAWMNAGYVMAEVDLESKSVTFRKPGSGYKVQPVDNTVKWNSDSIKALRDQMGLTQAQMAHELGIRQQTVSEWETGMYEPNRATSKYLSMVAEKAGFKYKTQT